MSIAPTEAPVATLTAKDLCDRCPNSRAYVQVILKWSPGLPTSGELFFCVHHADQYRDALAPYTSLIIDERFQLEEGIKDDKGVR